MSRAVARSALDSLVSRPVYLWPDAFQTGGDIGSETISTGAVLADLRGLAQTSSVKSQLDEAWAERKMTIASDYGVPVDGVNKPFAFVDGTAIIPVHGLLINRYPWSWGYCTGYNFIRSQSLLALADPDVKRIIYDVNSYGGGAEGCQETAQIVADVSAKKPTLAMVDGNCYSAAYFLCSQTRSLIVTPSGGVGSIGAIIAHMDISEALANFGVKVTLIVAGERKAEGTSLKPLTAKARARFQEDVDACRDVFVTYVAKGRDLSEEDVRATEAACYRADEALSLGLVDQISPAIEAVNKFMIDASEQCDDPNDPPEPEENDMPPVVKTETTAEDQAARDAAVQQANAEGNRQGAQAERDRIRAIMSHPEAVGRQTLAAKLAYDMDLSVEASATILAAAAKETAPVVVAEDKKPPVNPLTAGMQQSGQQQPNVGTGGTEGNDPDAAKPPAQRIMAAYDHFFGPEKTATKEAAH